MFDWKKIKLVMAPVEGYTDVRFRLLCKHYGADLVYSERINANAIVRGNKSAMKAMEMAEAERPIAMQIFGGKIDVMVKAAKMLEEKADIIDINMGCPAKNSMKIGACAALLFKPKKIQEMVEAVVAAVNKPVTVKIRADHALRNALIIQDAGASAIALHARYVKDGYSGKADWDLIKDVKKELKIPLIGNGDIRTAEDAVEMLKIADAAMIGRAAVKYPKIFYEARELLK
ncbi:MAG: tRNA-dihydrouridine synthase family protein [Nanoarchaeota archaeon]|nr:tRNA-dihydrouridine synthase family protein [Nanoarchaeota archaeon]